MQIVEVHVDKYWSGVKLNPLSHAEGLVEIIAVRVLTVCSPFC